MSIKSLILEIWRIVTKDNADLQEKVKLQDSALIKASKIIAQLINELDKAAQTIENQNEEALKLRAEIRRKFSRLCLNPKMYKIIPKKMSQELMESLNAKFANDYLVSHTEYYKAILELSPEIEGEIILPKGSK